MVREVDALSAALIQNIETQRLLVDELRSVIVDKDAQIAALNDTVSRLTKHITELTTASAEPAQTTGTTPPDSSAVVLHGPALSRNPTAPTGYNPARGPEKRPPPWTEDEIILVAAELVKNDWKPFNPSSATAQRLSNLLQQARIYPPEMRPPTFRNVNGVCRKSGDIASARPGYTGIRTAGASAVTIKVAEAFHDNPEKMIERARQIEEMLEMAQ